MIDVGGYVDPHTYRPTTPPLREKEPLMIGSTRHARLARTSPLATCLAALLVVLTGFSAIASTTAWTMTPPPYVAASTYIANPLLVDSKNRLLMIYDGKEVQRYESSPAGGSWSKLPQRPYSPQISRQPQVLLDGRDRLWVVGGGGDYRYEISMLDTETNVWRDIPKLSDRGDPANSAPTLGKDGCLYLFGGALGTGAYMRTNNKADRYCEDTRTWESIAPMPSALSGPVTAVLPDGRIVVANGITGPYSSTNAVSIYDPSKDGWTTLPSTGWSHARGFLKVTPSGQLVVAGGIDGSNTHTSAIETLEPGATSWQHIGDTPFTVSANDGVGNAGFSSDGMTFYVAGKPSYSTGSGYLTSFNAQTKTWKIYPAFSENLNYNAVSIAVTNEGRLYYQHTPGSGIPGKVGYLDTAFYELSSSVTTPSGDAVASLGEPVTVSYRVKNVSAYPATGVSVTDGLGTSLAVPDLAASASATVSRKFTPTKAQIDAGSISIPWSVSGTVNGAAATQSATPVSITTTPVTTGLTISQTQVFDSYPDAATATTTAKGGGKVDLGEKVTYTYTLKNTGNTALTGVALTEGKLAGVSYSPASVDLAVAGTAGNSATITATYTPAKAAILAGTIANSTTASGKIVGCAAGDTGCTSITVTTATASTASLTTIAPDPKLALTRNTPATTGQHYAAGTTVAFTYDVVNTGNRILGNLTAAEKATKYALTCTKTSLAPGQNTSCTATATM